MTAYQIMRDRCRAQDRRLSRVALPRPVPVRETVARRPAEVVPFTPPAISITAPKPETALDVHDFCLAQFTPAARKLAR